MSVCRHGSMSRQCLNMCFILTGKGEFLFPSKCKNAGMIFEFCLLHCLIIPCHVIIQTIVILYVVYFRPLLIIISWIFKVVFVAFNPNPVCSKYLYFPYFRLAFILILSRKLRCMFSYYSISEFSNFSLCLLDRGNSFRKEKLSWSLLMCHNQEAHGVPEILPTISCFCYYFSIFLPTSYISCVSPSTPTETPVFSNLFQVS